MFRDKEFSAALLVSILFHAFCMFAVTVVVMPTSFPIAKTSTISFLGPLFEKTAFELMLDDANPIFRADYPRLPVASGALKMTHGSSSMAGPLSVYTPRLKERGFKQKIRDMLGGFKLVPEYVPKSVGREDRAEGDRPFRIEGSASGREILFVPDAPDVNKRTDQAIRIFSVELKFSVDPSGKVESAEPIASSGYPDVDLAAIRYLKGFQFAPSEPKEDGAISGRIKLNLKSR
ncbi:MAG: energy transducer TonB [Candidatus Omnitrophota bacterium]